MTRSLLAFISAFFVLVGHAHGQQWTELGPAPITNGPYTGRIAAVACSDSDPDRYYVGGADGGVWRTTNGGVSWTPLTDDMPTTSIGALAVDPVDDNVVYVGTGEPNYANHSRYGLGLYKSSDGGDTWSHLARSVFAGRCFSRIIVNPQDRRIIFASITRAGGFPELAAAKGHPGAQGPLGVFRSTDGGVTWEHLTNGLPGPASGDQLTEAPPISLDRDDDPSLFQGLSATDLAMDPSNPDTLYAAIGRIFGAPRNGIYKTTDGGDSWVKLGGGLPTTVGRIGLAVAPSLPSRIYALLTNPSSETGGGASTLGGYRSDNGGATWTSIPIGSIQSSFGWYLAVVTVDPSNADTVIMGGVSLRRSTNSGSSWSTVTPPHVDMHAAAWDANGRLVMGDDGGVHRTTNLGNSWSSLNTGIGVIQFYAGLSTDPGNDLIVFGGTQDNGSNRRNSDTLSWTRVLGGDGGWTQLDQTSPARVFAEFQGTGNLFRSTNGGDSFSGVGSGISGRNCFLPPYIIDPNDPNHMLYATHRIHESTNGGTGWSVISDDLTNGNGAIRSLAIAPSNSSFVYAATNDGNVQLSVDGGATFQLIRSDHPGWPRVTRELFVDPTDALTVYLGVASFDTDQVLRSPNGGQSWVSLDGDLPNIPVNVVAAIPGNPPTIFAGTDSGIYFSEDDGIHWTRYGTDLPNVPVIDIRIDEVRQRIVIGTQGRGAWSVVTPAAVGEGGSAATDPDRFVTP